MHNFIGHGLESWCLACGFVVVLFVSIMFLVHVYVCCVFHFYIYQLFLVYCVYSVLSIMCIPTLMKTSKKINNVFGSHQNMLGLAFVFWVLASCVFDIFDFMLMFLWKSITFWKFVVLDVFWKFVVSVVCLCVTCIMYLCHMFCLFKCFQFVVGLAFDF